MQKFAFQLGTNKALSLGEIFSIAQDPNKVQCEGDVAITELPEAPLPQALMNRMGGTTRILEIVEEYEWPKDVKPNDESFLNDILTADNVAKHAFTNDARSYTLGALNMPRDISRMLSGIGIRLKKELKQINIKSRYVASRSGNMLTSATTFQNKLHDTKSELVVIKFTDSLYLARTVALQDIDDYSNRDEHRPIRDQKLGMLPLKVAQILINLAKAPERGVIYDPFVGLGTIVQESLLMGYDAYGSDIQEEVIDKAQENLAWLTSEYRNIKGSYGLKTLDATTITKPFDAKIDAVATEGFLGKPFGREPQNDEITAEFNKIESIYISALKALQSTILKPKSRVVICIPFYKTSRGDVFASFLDKIGNLGYHHVDLFAGFEGIPDGFNVKRKTFLYARPDAHVGREIAILETK